MKYALIADIHGNMPALQAVVNDAQAHKVQHFAFLGDYCIGLACPNEVLDCMRGLESTYVVSGNEDEAFAHWQGQSPTPWLRGQYEAEQWCYNQLSPQNQRYVCSLPQELVVKTDGRPPLTLFHKPERYFAASAPTLLAPHYYAQSVDDGLFTTGSFARHAANVLAGDNALAAQLDSLAQGVYAFGHKHIQWAWQQGGHLLVAPGSCGVPLDLDPRAAYAILEWTGTAWQCTLRRVEYDVTRALQNMQHSSCAVQLRVWFGILSREAETAREHALPFLHFAEQYATRRGDHARPFTHSTWQAAYTAWLGNRE